MRKTLWILLFLLGRAAAGQAQSPDVSARFDSNWVETGELFTLEISVSRHVGKPDPVDFQAWEQDSVHLHNQSGWKPEGEAYVNRFSLITFDADTLLLPPLQVAWGNGQTATTDSLPLVVMATPSPDELADIEDIKDIYREPARWTDYLPWIAIIGFLVLLALLAGWWYRRRKNRPAVVAQRVIEQPAHILALRKLQLLKRPDGQHPTQVKTYYADLTYIFREYLEKRYGFPALESVSAEIVTALAATSFPKSLLPALTALLEEADQVKFAKGLPADSYHAKAWALVKEAVEATAETARVQPTKA